MRYDLASDGFVADPYPTLAEMRRADPCWFDHRLEAYVVTRFHDVERVLQDPDFSAQRVEQFAHGAPEHLKTKVEVFVRELGRWLLFVDPPHHTALRARLLRAFGPWLLPRIAEAARGAIARTLDEIAVQPSPDIIRDYAYPIPTRVLATILGISTADIERFKQWTTDIFTLVGAGFADEETVEIGYKGAVELRDFVLQLLEQKRRTPSDDVLSALAERDPDGASEIDDNDIVGLFMSIIVAGHETTTNLIGNAIDNLIADADARRHVTTNGALSEHEVDELIRFDGPVLSMLRRAKRDVVVAGQRVKQGDVVVSVLSAANRDPRRHAQPDRLDFQRSDSGHLGLGVGMHRCVGAAMARCVTGLAVPAFHSRFSKASVGIGVRHRNLSFRGYASLPADLYGTGDDAV